MAYNRRKAARRKQTMQGWALLFIVVVVVVIGAAAYINTVSNRVVLNDSDFCPVDGPEGYVAVLLDKSDPLTVVQKDFVLRFFAELSQRDVPKFYRVELFTTDSESPTQVSKAFSICNPGDGSDKSIVVSNPKLARKRWEHQFQAPIVEWLENNLQPSEESYSPLMQTIANVSSLAFPALVKKKPRKLIIVSDMLENTPEYSQYRAGMDFFRVSSLPVFTRLAPNLRGVDVEIVYVKRPGQERLQTMQHIQFWEEFFATFGARLTRVLPI